MKEYLQNRASRLLIAGALAVGVMGGSYGIAAAASNSSSGSNSSNSGAAQPSPPGPGRPWGGQRPDETRLTGDAAAKVTAAAKARISGGTVIRVETDADGHAKYEAHMTDANGQPVTVYVDADFNVVSVERR